MEAFNLRNACNAGFVSMSKKEWEELDYYQGQFMLSLESSSRKKMTDDMKKDSKKHKVGNNLKIKPNKFGNKIRNTKSLIRSK